MDLVQTRSEKNGINYFTSIKEAFAAAEKDQSIWKISFDFQKERVRLVRHTDDWSYEPIEV